MSAAAAEQGLGQQSYIDLAKRSRWNARSLYASSTTQVAHMHEKITTRVTCSNML